MQIGSWLRSTLSFGKGLSSLGFSYNSIGIWKDHGDVLYGIQSLVPYQSSLAQEPYCTIASITIVTITIIIAIVCYSQ